MQAKPLPTKEELDKRFSYDPITGNLTSKKSKRVIKAKDPKGYLVVTVNFSRYKAHRIIWLMMTGEDPGENMIDHDNRTTGDNRWVNLIQRDNSGNNFNNNARGYSREGNRWRARLTYKNQLILHKFFVEEQDAIDAVKTAKKKILHPAERDAS